MIYERSERRSTFLIGYCVSRLNHFVDRIFTQFDTSQDVIREVRNHLLLAEENVFMLARANERALAIEMTGMINRLVELCDGTSELDTGREATLTLDRHRATVLADKIETLGSIAVPPVGDMRTIYEFAAALAWYVNIAEAGVVDHQALAWQGVQQACQRLADREQNNAKELFDVDAPSGNHLCSYMAGRIYLFGVRLHNLDSRSDDGAELEPQEIPQASQGSKRKSGKKRIDRVGQNDARDAFMHDRYKNGATLKEIRSLVNRNPDWSHIDTDQGAQQAIYRYDSKIRKKLGNATPSV